MSRPHVCPSCGGSGYYEAEPCEQCAGQGMLKREGSVTLPWRPVMPAVTPPQPRPVKALWISDEDDEDWLARRDEERALAPGRL